MGDSNHIRVKFWAPPRLRQRVTDVVTATLQSLSSSRCHRKSLSHGCLSLSVMEWTLAVPKEGNPVGDRCENLSRSRFQRDSFA